MTLLGSGGWYPTAQRETSSLLITAGSQGIIIDTGTGIKNLLRWPALAAGVSSWSVVYSHFHLDHLLALEWLKGLGVTPLTVYGPGRWLYQRPTEEILQQFFRHPYLPPSGQYQDLISDVRELSPDSGQVGALSFTVRQQKRHSDPSVAFRLGDSFAYCTDTGLDPETVDFVSGVNLLLHEAGSATDRHPRHSSGAEAGKIAAQAGVDELLLTHHLPGASEEEILSAARQYFPNSHWGFDGWSRTLADRS